jgi:hypothetical protein
MTFSRQERRRIDATLAMGVLSALIGGGIKMT